MVAPSPPTPSTVDDYRSLYEMRLHEWLVYHQQSVVFGRCSWMGLPALKNPFDAWIYQEIVAEVRPDIIVEIGSNQGGSTLYLAHLLDLLGGGRVVTIDIDHSRFEARHDRIELLTGPSASTPVLERVAEACAGRRAIVIHDGDHSRAAVLEDLRRYGRFVSVGSYLIVEDGIIDVMGTEPCFRLPAGGPFQAVDQFLAESPGFVVDAGKERYLLTYNPRGFLRRVR